MMKINARNVQLHVLTALKEALNVLRVYQDFTGDKVIFHAEHALQDAILVQIQLFVCNVMPKIIGQELILHNADVQKDFC